MDKKRGNDCERERNRIEDRIIREIDREPDEKGIYRNHGPLYVSVFEIICYRAATTGIPAMMKRL